MHETHVQLAIRNVESIKGFIEFWIWLGNRSSLFVLVSWCKDAERPG